MRTSYLWLEERKSKIKWRSSLLHQQCGNCKTFCPFSAQLWREAPLTFHLQRPAISDRSICSPIAAEHCNATVIQPPKICVCCCCQALILNASVTQRPTSAGNKPKLIMCLSLSLSLYHTRSCLMPSVFHLLNTILHSQWFRIRAKL